MWWYARLSGAFAPDRPQIPACAIRRMLGPLRVWHDPSGPGLQAHHVSVPGCELLLLGCITDTAAEVHRIAIRLARGDQCALQQFSGSQTAIAALAEKVLVTGDLAGQRMVYYAQLAERQLLLGSDAGGLAQPVGQQLDRRWLAARLLVPDMADVWAPASPWRGVHVLRPGWTLELDRASGAVTTSPSRCIPRPELSLTEAGHVLRDALRHAVRSRVTSASCPTSDLSGGLDSSTVAALAGQVRPGLSALTVSAESVEDANAASDIAREMPTLEHHLVDLPLSLLPYADLEHVPLLDEPDAAVATFARERWRLAQVAKLGSDLHLGGDGGDAVLLAPPTYLADLTVARHVRELSRHASGWGRLRNVPPASLVRAALDARRTSYADVLRRSADQLVGEQLGGGWSSLVSRGIPSGAAAWCGSDARGLVADMLREHAEAYRSPMVPGEFGIGDSAAWLALNGFARGQRLYDQLAAACCVSHHAPYLDNEVVRACWSTPAWRRTTPDRVKPLLGEAMRYLVPPRLLHRRTKGDYTALAYAGLRRHADALCDLFTGSRLHALGILDEEAIHAELRRGIAGLPIRLGAFDHVLGTELWLRTAAPYETRQETVCRSASIPEAS